MNSESEQNPEAPFNCGASFIFPPSQENIAIAAKRLKEGKLVAVPTETVYGLAANALNADACRKIFEIKGRPLLDPLIVHLLDVKEAEQLAVLNETFLRLAEVFWPGPLTMVVPKKPVIPDIVTAGKATVALRSPAHPVMRDLLMAAGFPLAAPSANPFAYISPTTAQHVEDSLGSKVEFILDGGPSRVGLESTIISLTDPSNPVLLRPGGIPTESVEAVIGQRLGNPQKGIIEAPGMLEKHYSPKTRLKIFTGTPPMEADQPSAAWLYLYRPKATRNSKATSFWLSESNDLAEAARTLFSMLRQLDDGPWAEIWIEKAPADGLGNAINDRIHRAAAKS